MQKLAMRLSDCSEWFIFPFKFDVQSVGWGDSNLYFFQVDLQCRLTYIR